MTPTKSSALWLGQAPDYHRFPIAVGAALLLEGAALLWLVPTMTHREVPSDVAAPIKLSIIAPAPAPMPPPPAKPAPLPPKPAVPPPPLPPTPPLPLAPPLPPPPPIPRPAQHVFRHYVRPYSAPPPRAVAPTPAVQAPPTPPPPAAPPAPTGGQVDAFSAAIKRALQARADSVYPQAAQMARESGKPELTFTYLNGIVTHITLARSSGFPLLDAAALEDARIAEYPAPPKGFKGRIYQITVGVNFMLAAPSVDGD